MSDLTKIGIAKAHCGGTNYVPIGVVFRDGKDKLVIKIDSLPLGASGWTGWINVFEEKKTPDEGAAAVRKQLSVDRDMRARPVAAIQDDIPF